MLGTTISQAEAGGDAEGPPLRISEDQVESALAFADVIAGIHPDSQTEFPDSIRRLRLLNPNAVILPYRITEEQEQNPIIPAGMDTSLEYQFLNGLAEGWYLKDTKGNYVPDPAYPFIRKMNISPYSPIVNGGTYFSALLNWLNQSIFPSGVWDGVFFDNLFGHINPHILNYSNPSLLDVDYQRTGVRNETPAWVNDMTRTVATGMLQQFRDDVGNLQLVIGNAGSMPELSLAPYVNGYLFECMNSGWNSAAVYGSGSASQSQAGWRAEFEAYRIMQAGALPPRVNLLQGCGPYNIAPGQGYSVPTAADLQSHRLTMGTTLLSDGFYGFSLHGGLSVPIWMDEYSVNSAGTAVQDMTQKGYLGQALMAATELTGAGTPVFQEGFENGVVPASFIGCPAGVVSVTQNLGQVITGMGSLVIGNEDYAALRRNSTT